MLIKIQKTIHENASESIVCEMAATLSRGDELISRRARLAATYTGYGSVSGLGFQPPDLNVAKW